MSEEAEHKTSGADKRGYSEEAEHKTSRVMDEEHKSNRVDMRGYSEEAEHKSCRVKDEEHKSNRVDMLGYSEEADYKSSRKDMRDYSEEAGLASEGAPELADDQAAFVTGVEAGLVKQLTEGVQTETDPQEEAISKLSPRWEIRIESAYDPVAEETAQYRKLAKEVDGRYDKDRV